MTLNSKIRFDPSCPYKMEKEGKYPASSEMFGIISSSEQILEKSQIL